MLYLIPTPIGNREDITMRALRLFKELDVFICEDTRTLKKLLSMYEIDYSDKKFFSLTSFTDQGKMNHYLNLLGDNDVGMTSEAGTPGLSDPGKSLIQLCNENNLEYTVLPGANALVPAVVGSAFDTSSFVYLGFMPQKKGRQTILKDIIAKKYGEMPLFFYESVHRFEKLLRELGDLGFEGKISVSRELSKKFEQIVNGSLEEISELVKSKKLPIRGEFVVGLN